MAHLNLGSLRLVLSWEQPDPCCEEEQDEESSVFSPPLSLNSPSSEQRKAYQRNCRRRKLVSSALQGLLIRSRNTFTPKTGGSGVPIANTIPF